MSTPTTTSDASGGVESFIETSPYDIQIMNLEDSPFDSEKLGLSIWRIENEKLVPVNENNYGFFHEEAVYIILNVNDDGSKFLHHWRGKLSTEMDKSTGHKILHQMDQQLDGAQIFSCQYQGYESSCFSCLFPEGILYLEGSPKTAPRKAAKYRKTLYSVTGRGWMRAQCVEAIVEELSDTGAVILDGFPRIYVWIGDQCPFSTRVKVIHLARKMRSAQRKGQAHIIVVDSTDPDAEKSFLRKLGSRPRYSCDSSTVSNDIVRNPVLHRLSGDRVLYDMPVVSTQPINQRYLVRSDSYLLDSGPHIPIYVWIGHRAASRDFADAVMRGMHFSNHFSYPSVNSICRVREGWETEEFKQSFLEWRESTVRYRNRSKSRPNSCFSAAKSELSTFDTPAYITFNSVSDDTNLVDSEGTTEIWFIKDDNLEAVPWDKHGIFYNGYCYIILHHTMADGSLKHILYYWLGTNSTSEDQNSTVKLGQSLNSTLNNTAIVIRILDGKESPNFLTVLQYSMIVYDTTLQARDNEEQMFIVKELDNGSMKVIQVAPDSTCLKTTLVAIFLSDVDCILWYGKNSGSCEREYAKTILEFLIPSRMYTFDVILEGKENKYFWNILGGRKLNLDERKSTFVHDKRLPRLLYSSQTGSQLTDIYHFTQLDLTDDGIFIMDLFNQIMIWYGQSSNSEVKEKIPKLLLEFIEAGPAGRKEENVEIWFIYQGSEPSTFRQLFPSWVEQGYGNKTSYELMRKKVRQENAIIHIHVEIDDLDHVTKAKYDPFILLKGNLPDDVDSEKKEDHLSDYDFIEVYKVTRSQFYRLPFWKQGQILRSSKLAP